MLWLMRNRRKSKGLSLTELVLALVMLALMAAVFAIGLDLRQHIQ